MGAQSYSPQFCGPQFCGPQFCGPQFCGPQFCGPQFCGKGCEAAHRTIAEMGLESYYQRRLIDRSKPPLRPGGDETPRDYESYVNDDGDGVAGICLMVEGLQGPACMWLIESILSRQPGVVMARMNLTERRLFLKWRSAKADVNSLAGKVLALGYRLAPFDPRLLASAGLQREKELLRALAVAGLAAANVMLLSVAAWAGFEQGMGAATRSFLYWLSALIALPSIAYAGREFFRSAYAGLKQGRLNMDAPIALALIMAPGMSLYEVMTGGPHAYFDSAAALLFFLLTGRYLDCRARVRARFAVAHLLALGASSVTVVDSLGGQSLMPPSRVKKGMKVMIAAGERLGVDGVVLGGESLIDVSSITGESLPAPVSPGDRVFAGSMNLANPVTVEASAAGEDTLLAEIVRIMKAAEQAKTRYIGIADRIAAIYGPAANVLELAAFAYWMFLADASWHEAMVISMTVAIIACPCALALAVPAVQVAAASRLFGKGVLLKQASALERLAEVDAVVFDKTGTLTTGRLELANRLTVDEESLMFASSMAAASRHPLSRSLRRAAPLAAAAENVLETPGKGLALVLPEGEARLGSREWCQIASPHDGEAFNDGGELWLARPRKKAVRFSFGDHVRHDAKDVVAKLQERGFKVWLMSGDRVAAVEGAAAGLGIKEWRAGLSPAGKCALLERLRSEGHRVLMVGDGLNDAPALAAAHASMSPSTAADIAKNAADAVFQGESLRPVIMTLDAAILASRLFKQNLAFALAYNAAVVPLALAGMATPLLAAIAMSSSSLAVAVNALRMGRS